MSGHVGGDEQDLASLLRQSEARVDAAELRDLIAGVAAAPVGFDPDSWMLLIADHPCAALRQKLSALLAEERKRHEPRSGDRAARLAALRAEMGRLQLTGFIVPRTDEHQGEYVAARSERLAWLTGFTGSAGTAVVLRDRAALFVDGRYTTQAANEVDTTLFPIHHVIEQPLPEWLASELPSEARIGYDPWLHTPNQATALHRACGKAGARAVPVERNLIDRVWTDQPPPPIAPVVPHSEEFAGQSYGERCERIAEALRKEKQDAAVLVQPDSIAWLLNIRGGDVPYSPLPLAFGLLHADARVDLFIDPRKLTRAAQTHLGDRVTVAPPDALAQALDRLGGSHATVRIDPDRSPEWVVRRLREKSAVIAEGADPCLLPKATKTDRELAGIREAHVRDGVALARFLAWLSIAAAEGGLSESAAAERLAAFRSENERYRGPSFPTISAAGHNGAIIHYRVSAQSDRLLTPGTLYLVDSGAQYLDGTTDVTRTVALGEPTAEMRQRFTLVLKGHIAIATACFPRGTTGSQLDVLARQAMWRAGIDYDHGTGHGVGYYLGVHEGPQRISKLPSRVALQPGMVVSNEPGYYKPGDYGIRIENLVVVARIETPPGGEQQLLGFETLTLAPIHRALIDRSFLDPSETDWLDGYHARVRETLAPLVDRQTRLWLDDATRPLSALSDDGECPPFAKEPVMRWSWLILSFVVLVLGSIDIAAQEASFDCLKAAAPIEQLICSDPQLVKLDGAVGEAFAAVRQRLPEKDRAGALAEQRAWLSQRLKQCEVPAKGGEELALDVRWRAAPCLDQMYRARLAALGAPAEPSPNPLPQSTEPGFIHPACLWQLIEQDPDEKTKSPPRIPLGACALGNRHIPISLGDEGSLSAQGAAEGFPTWLSYRLLGKLPDGRDVAIVWYSSGGTGQFSELFVLQRTPTAGLREIVLSGELIAGGGDRCNGGIERAKLADGQTLQVDYNLTPLDLVSEADEDVAEQAFEDLLSCAICCIGTVRRRLDLANKKETTVSATITQFLEDEMTANGGPKSVQACFDRLVRKAAGPLPHTFAPAEITALAQSFAKTCLKK